MKNRKVVIEEEQKQRSTRVVNNNQERNGRSESESKKRVKINEVPEYAPQTAKPVIKSKVETQVQFSNQNVKLATGSGHRQKTIIVIMPVGIPGMGKSTFVENQLKPYFESIPDVKFVTFASDAIRKDILEDTLARNKSQGINKTRDQVF